jgi:hypothetical protein
MKEVKRKRIQRNPIIRQRHRDRFLDALAHGLSPTSAARVAGIGRSTLYEDRRKNQQFAKAWEDAAQQGIDRLEDEAYRRAMAGSDALLMFLLRGRRPEVYARHTIDAPVSRVNVTNVLTFEEAMKQIEDLGLPPLMLEGDYEQVDVPSTGKAENT